MNNVLSRETLVIDGSNIFGLSSYRDIAPLYALFCEIIERGNDFYCVFDANVRRKIKENLDLPSRETFDNLLERYSDKFFVVTGSSTADSAILFNADKHERRIISNDLYRDFVSKYSWLENRHTDRLIQGNYQEGGLATFEKINIDFVVKESPERLYEKLCDLINKNEEHPECFAANKKLKSTKQESSALAEEGLQLRDDLSSLNDELSKLKDEVRKKKRIVSELDSEILKRNKTQSDKIETTKKPDRKTNIIDFKRKDIAKPRSERISIWDDHYVTCRCGVEHLSTYPHKCKK